MGQHLINLERSKKWDGDTIGYAREELKDMGWENDSEIITDEGYISKIKTNFGETLPIEGSVIISSLNGGGKKLIWASTVRPQWLIKRLEE